MKFLKFFIIIFISLASSVKADLNNDLFTQLKDGGKLIFIRHAYAPGSGDPQNFNLNDCSTQRNLSNSGREQSKNIGDYIYIEIPYEERDHALYVAYGPYKNPRYALSIIVEHGGSGSATAAPMAKKLFKLVIDRHKVRESVNEKKYLEI